MKRILLSLSLLLLACNGFAQKGFGVDGSIGMGRNGGDLVYPFLIEGRVQFNDNFSLNLGLGLWNSGFKGGWKVDGTTTSTLYQLTSDKTLPSIQLSPRVQIPVFTLDDKQVRFFVEPKLYFLPFSAQKVNLEEIYHNIIVDEITQEKTYKATGQIKNTTFKSECHPRLYTGIQAGLAVELVENVDLAVSYGYTKMDLFEDVRGKAIESWSFDPYLPRTDLHLISVSFLINFDLN